MQYFIQFAWRTNHARRYAFLQSRYVSSFKRACKLIISWDPIFRGDCNFISFSKGADIIYVILFLKFLASTYIISEIPCFYSSTIYQSSYLSLQIDLIVIMYRVPLVIVSSPNKFLKAWKKKKIKNKRENSNCLKYSFNILIYILLETFDLTWRYSEIFFRCSTEWMTKGILRNRVWSTCKELFVLAG